jgi:hypothetical protein
MTIYHKNFPYNLCMLSSPSLFFILFVYYYFFIHLWAEIYVAKLSLFPAIYQNDGDLVYMVWLCNNGMYMFTWYCLHKYNTPTLNSSSSIFWTMCFLLKSIKLRLYKHRFSLINNLNENLLTYILRYVCSKDWTTTI